MKVTTLAQLKKGDFFYTEKEYNKYGDNDKYLRVKYEYDKADKKWYCPRFYTDALGNGKYFKPSTRVISYEEI